MCVCVTEHADDRSNPLLEIGFLAQSMLTGPLPGPAQMQSSAYFKSTTGKNKYGWYPVSCTSNYLIMCEVPKSAYNCPPEPPPAPSPAPGAPVCKL